MATVIQDEFDGRSDPRDEVFHRARARFADGEALLLLVVNISPGGFMARCERVSAPGEAVVLDLPGIGAVAGHIRWALGGRIGCRFDRAVAPADYARVLRALNT